VESNSDVLRELELAICSKSTFRILVVMAKQPRRSFTKYALGKEALLNDRDVNYAIKRLLEINWIKELNYGKVKLYRININNYKVNLFVKFLKEVKCI